MERANLHAQGRLRHVTSWIVYCPVHVPNPGVSIHVAREVSVGLSSRDQTLETLQANRRCICTLPYRTT